MKIFLNLLFFVLLCLNCSLAQSASAAPNDQNSNTNTDNINTEIQHSDNNKKTSHVPVLVTQTKDVKPTELKEKDDFSFYIAPFIGFGAFLTDSIQVANYPYLSGELRMGFRVSERFYAMFSVETGFNIKDRSYPSLTTITVAPEFYVIDSLSVFAGIGLGILTANTNITSNILTETRAGFEWKIGLNWQAVKWGEKDEYVFPISIAYTGAKTKWVTCHTIMLSLGFMFFN
jgi:opacity protein-like surface antigen